MSRRLHRQAGFTLIELTVSLVAGLIVALGIMALSKEATRTFNEEVRGAAAEATMRTAIDRLRADLQRAGYMSTAQIMGDPTLAKVPGTLNAAGVKLAGIQHLQSVYLNSGGSLANGLTLSGFQTPALTPDSFDLGGNMTTAEQFEVQMVMPTAGGGCTQILLSSASAAMYRIAATGLGTPASNFELRNAFQPVPPGLSTQFIVRLVDTTGHTQYLATCPTAAAAGFNGTQPYVNVDTSSTPIQYASQTTGAGVGQQAIGGVTGYCVGCILNPVQLVRWEVTSSTNEAANTAQYAIGLDNTPTGYVAGVGTLDPNKYDLVRTYLDASDNYVYETSEVVAEYAVDLKLAFSVDATILGDQFPAITTLAFTDTTNATRWAPTVSPLSVPAPNQGPQRIRSARVRLVTRAAQPDRTVTVGVPSPGGLATDFMYRYCVNSSPSCATSDGTLRWARARTVTAEVSLPNQSQDFF
jgi:prepilin-type N-terminal cleavage/methylation domain-containing protein